jgi:GNAT superfamily N-acetyltransferase
MPTPQTADRSIDTLVRRAGAADVPGLVDVLSASFAEDPVVRWITPDPDRRAESDAALFRVAVESNLGYGEVYAGEAAPAAAALWVPPGVVEDPDAEARLVERYVAAVGESAERLRTCLGMMAEVHPPEPHAYLFLLGTRPERQGGGLGSALLRHVLDRCDREGTPAYLEATTRGSRRLYLRHGFADTGLIQLPDGPPMWRMWRDPL